MKCLISSFFVVGLSASGALAADVASRIDAVDLHPDAAEVTRIAHSSLPAGDSTIVLHGLSSHMIEDSLHVSGLDADGISIRSVSTRRIAGVASASPRKQQLVDEEQTLRSRIEALETKRSMILAVAKTQPSVTIGAPGSTAAPEFWSTLWTNVANGLEETDHALHDAHKRLDIVTTTLAAMPAADPDDASHAQSFDVVLDLAADRATEADFKILYQVTEARWQPVYDARLHTDRQPARLDLTRRAEIVQGSGEDWNDVAVTLATSALSASTQAPTLSRSPDVTEDAAAKAVPRAVVSKPVGDFSLPPDIASPVALPYDARLTVPGRLSIASGAPSKVYTISSQSIDAEVIVKSAPIVEPRAYLQATFQTKDRIPLIPGGIALYRDGTFIGRSRMKGAISGDPVVIGFGADDLVSVERSEIGRRDRNTTVASGIASVERTFKTIVTNRHTFPIRIEIDDREPSFDNVAIEMKELAVTTPPTSRQVGGERGVLAWSYTYAPSEVRTLALAWRVRWPARLGPIQGQEQTQYFRFSGAETF